nr:tetratricopeptide repeat protein [Leptospira weilii]
MNYYPENRFHYAKEIAEICVWASADLGLRIFQDLLDEDQEQQPKYAGGASLISALLIHFPDRWESILEISKIQKYTKAVYRSLETAKNRTLGVTNDPLAGKLKQNQIGMETISILVDKIGEIILAAPPGVYSEEEIHTIRHKKVFDRLAKGWDHLKKKEYTKTEELLRSIFSDYAEDTEALFLDARLHWLKTESPEEGIKRAEKNLLAAAKGDLPGRGRLHNLIGCALYEIGKLEEAIPAFRKAEELCPEDCIYPANLAEIFWKLGDARQAARYAKKAKSMGDNRKSSRKFFNRSNAVKNRIEPA